MCSRRPFGRQNLKMPQHAKRSTRAKKVTKQIKSLAYASKRVKGHGIYVEDKITNKPPGTVNRLARMAGEALGSAIPLIPGIGKLIPAPLVSAASSALGDAGSWLAKAFGFGRYTISRNSLMKPMVRGGPGGARVENMPEVAAPPVFSNGEGSDIIITHREFVGNVKSSINFTTTTYPINPGNPILYPFFSRIASLYEEFDIMGQLMEFRPTSATAVGTTSSAMGVVIMATDYDCYDSNFTSKRQMEAAEFSSAAVPYETFIHPIECDRTRNVLSQQYVVPGIVDASQAPGDRRLSVLGNFTIATEGQQADNTDIGELWVTYHIRVSRPCLQSYVQSTSLYAAQGIGTVTTSGIPTISSQRVSQDLPGFGWAHEGLGTTSRLLIDNTANKVQGVYQIWTVSSSTSFSTPATPVNQDVVCTGDVRTLWAVANDNARAYCNSTMSNSLTTAGSQWIQVFTTWVRFTGTGTVSIPVLHGSDVGCNYRVLISQYGEPWPLFPLSQTFTNRQLLLNATDEDDEQKTSTESSSSSTFQPGLTSVGAAAAAKAAVATPIPTVTHTMVRR